MPDDDPKDTAPPGNPEFYIHSWNIRQSRDVMEMRIDAGSNQRMVMPGHSHIQVDLTLGYVGGDFNAAFERLRGVLTGPLPGPVVTPYAYGEHMKRVSEENTQLKDEVRALNDSIDTLKSELAYWKDTQVRRARPILPGDQGGIPNAR